MATPEAFNDLATGQQRFAGSSKLLAAAGLSLAVHVLLIWPLPVPRAAPDAPAGQAGALRLVPAAPATAAAAVTVAENLAAVPNTRLSVDRPPPVAGVAGAALSVPDRGTLPPGVAEPSLRAFRYAIARAVVRDGVLLQEAGARMVIALQLHARRVVAVSLVRSSGHDETDARVMAAFRAAASSAVMAVELPAHGFVVELELEGEPTDAGQDEHATAPG